jgi:hypothetical protein
MRIRSLSLPSMLGLFVGCGGGGGGDDCQPGTHFCQCLAGTCQIGLECNNNYCLYPGEDPPETSGDGDPGDGDPGDGDPGDGDPGDGDPGDGDPGDGDPGDGDGDSGGPFVFPDDPPGDYVRVDRMGMPAVATAVISNANKDNYNAADPTDDANSQFVAEIGASVQALHIALDDDLVDIGLVPCTVADCLGQAGPLVIPDTLKIDLDEAAGFPNGRRLADQVIDITLAVLLVDLTVFGQGPDIFADLPLNPGTNDASFDADFPYLAAPN